jgi:hypothetical protein
MTAFTDDDVDVGQPAWAKVISKVAQQLDGWIVANSEVLLKK